MCVRESIKRFLAQRAEGIPVHGVACHENAQLFEYLQSGCLSLMNIDTFKSKIYAFHGRLAVFQRGIHPFPTWQCLWCTVFEAIVVQ